jgi:hypothetical protein
MEKTKQWPVNRSFAQRYVRFPWPCTGTPRAIPGFPGQGIPAGGETHGENEAKTKTSLVSEFSQVNTKYVFMDLTLNFRCHNRFIRDTDSLICHRIYDYCTISVKVCWILLIVVYIVINMHACVNNVTGPTCGQMFVDILMGHAT